MIVVDTSALLSIAFDEIDAAVFVQAIELAPRRLISAVSFVEANIVIDGRRGRAMVADVELLVMTLAMAIEPLTTEQARLASQAYRAFGKGNHPAGLNFGDCFAYALAKATGLPLLFKGNDFAQTDIPRADVPPA